MAFFKHRTMRWIWVAVVNLVAAEMSIYLLERFETFPGHHWLSRWLFTTIIEFLIKETLMFMLRGLATVAQNRTVGKSFRNFLSSFRKKKIFPEVTDVVVN